MMFEQFRTSSDGIEKLKRMIAAETKRDITIMEVCGTHTMAIFRHGIRDMIPDSIKLLSGPGCPVCVTQNAVIDKMIWLARQSDVIIATFGDMLRVPGSSSSLDYEKANGAKVQVVYSPLLALELAKNNPDKKVVFIAVGFETTIPAIAVALKKAKENGITNFFVLCAHKTVPKALEAIACMDNNVDGLLLPGHVSSIIGANAYDFLASKYETPGVIAGFEPLDLLKAIYMIVKMIMGSKKQIINAYERVVSETGNIKAQQIIAQVFMPCDAQWRGLGIIPESGLRLNAEYKSFDIEENIRIDIAPPQEPAGCLCGQILCGIKTPVDCTHFGKKCVPETPVGPCMVSTEGTCAAYYKYRNIGRVNS
jgi:hydrogenase expression/formation protein HypD